MISLARRMRTRSAAPVYLCRVTAQADSNGGTRAKTTTRGWSNPSAKATTSLRVRFALPLADSAAGGAGYPCVGGGRRRRTLTTNGARIVSTHASPPSNSEELCPQRRGQGTCNNEVLRSKVPLGGPRLISPGGPSFRFNAPTAQGTDDLGHQPGPHLTGPIHGSFGNPSAR